MNSEHRVAKLRERLAAEGVDAIAVTNIANVAYVTGFDGVFDEVGDHIAVVTQEQSVLVTDSLYREAAGRAAEGTAWRVAVAQASLADLAADVIGPDRRVALEDTLTVKRFGTLEKAFGEVVTASGWVEAFRAVKDDEEVARIAAAQAITDAGFAHILERLRRGVSERDIALELEFFLRRNGSEGMAFVPIIASGPNSALPHAKITERVLQAGDFVKMDFGAMLDGYRSDMTRTVVLGSASERHREIYDAVLEANRAGIAAVAPGVSGVDVDAAARAVIEERGFGDNFGHGLGHGVGLDIHELPFAGPRSKDTMESGCVITIEPGVYVPGFGGVRIEDLVVVVEGGSRVMTRSPKDLIEL